MNLLAGTTHEKTHRPVTWLVTWLVAHVRHEWHKLWCSQTGCGCPRLHCDPGWDCQPQMPRLPASEGLVLRKGRDTPTNTHTLSPFAVIAEAAVAKRTFYASVAPARSQHLPTPAGRLCFLFPVTRKPKVGKPGVSS